MKTYTVLYYPDFHPDAVWLRRILLLADEVTRIVPLDVELHDPEDLLALQNSIPGCLSAISPEEGDIAIERDNLPRLAKAFAFLARSRGPKKKKKKIVIEISELSVSIAGHVFLHTAKISPVIRRELRRNGLIIPGLEKIADREGFIVVDASASDLILSGIAENISRRTGLDAITDKPVPFALTALNGLGVRRTPTLGGAEGAVLAALTSILIPAEVATLKLNEYRDLRNSYASIRGAFKELTADLARINRLNHIQDPRRLTAEVEATAQEFGKEYQTFRKSRYARNFKGWAPLYVGGLVSMIGTAVAPHVALGVAGVSLVVQTIQKVFESPAASPGRDRVFNMVAGLRKDIIRQSGVKAII
jgi:hypothetical protein